MYFCTCASVAWTLTAMICGAVHPRSAICVQAALAQTVDAITARLAIVANRWLETSLLAPDGKRATEGCGRFKWSPVLVEDESQCAAWHRARPLTRASLRTVSTLLVVRRRLVRRQVKKPSRKCWRPIR